MKRSQTSFNKQDPEHKYHDFPPNQTFNISTFLISQPHSNNHPFAIMKFFTTAFITGLATTAVAVPNPIPSSSSSATPIPLPTPIKNHTSPDVGKKILDVALTAKGTPYAWGGGTCKGPSGDQPPYDYGEVGYDCSGLVGWAVCKVTGRDLFSEGLRVTGSMYCASEKKLKYKYELPGR